MNRVCEILGIEEPVVQAPMLWLTSPELVAAVSNAGGLGVLGVGAGSTEPEGSREATNEAFRAAVRRTKELTDKPFGVNLMTAASDPKGHNADTLAIMRDEGVSAVVLVGDEFGDGEIAALKEDGFKVIARQLNPTVAGAKRLQELGADAVVATGCDEGGVMPAGATGTMAMVALMCDALDIPVLAAGGIVNERFARASAVLGAEGAFAGTRFILSRECRAAQATKQDLIGASADDMTVITVWGGAGRWRTTPTVKAAAAARANAAGDLNPDQGDYRKSELLGLLDEANRGEFDPLTEREMLEEVLLFVENLECDCYFNTHHTVSGFNLSGPDFLARKDDIVAALRDEIENGDLDSMARIRSMKRSL